MLRGLYTAASGMLATQLGMDTTANNLANVNTIGFKGSNTSFKSFPEMLMKRMSINGNNDIGTMVTGAQMMTTQIDFSQGDLMKTDNPLDVGIRGDGFFTVQGEADEMLYTRRGEFTISPDGFLCTIEGQLVMGENGAIPMQRDERVKITEDGSILGSDGQRIEKLKITTFEDNAMLEKAGTSLYKASEGAITTKLAENSVGIHQGMLERPNTNPVRELVNNIQAVRLYEALQKSMQTQNMTLGKAVNEVGSYR